MGSGKKQPILGALAGSVLGFFGVALGLFAVRDVFGLAGDQIRPFLWSVTIGCSLLDVDPPIGVAWDRGFVADFPEFTVSQLRQGGLSC
ncbi:MAG: hypothetical protein ACI92S_003871, partial [Planctomycetaceae bacterium]